MKLNLSKQIIGVLAVLVTSGCASTGTAPVALEAANSVAINSIGSAALGDVVSVPAGIGIDSRAVVVTSEYMAASRRLCRRMQTPDGEPLSRVACKNDKGQWLLARDLVPSATHLMSTRALPQTQVMDTPISSVQSANELESAGVVIVETENVFNEVVADELVTDELAVNDYSDESTDISMQPLAANSAVAHVVLANETLWSFAKRTTGNALNWERIAEINSIDDARTVSGGDVLQVPFELSKSGS